MNKLKIFLIFLITIMQCSNSFASAAKPSQTDQTDPKELSEKCGNIIDELEYELDVLALREGTLKNVNKKYGHNEDTLLMRLVELNDPELFALAMAMKPDVNAVNRYNDTALGLACYLSSDSNIIQALLDAGANVHHIDNRGNTPLMQAALSQTWRQRDLVNVMQGIQYLVNKGSNIDYKNKHTSSNILCSAMVSYHVPLVIFLLRNNVIVDKITTTALALLQDDDSKLDELGISKEERKEAWTEMRNAFEIYALGQKDPYYNSKKNDDTLSAATSDKKERNSDTDTDIEDSQKVFDLELKETESDQSVQEKSKNTPRMITEDLTHKTLLTNACFRGNEAEVDKLLQDAHHRRTINTTDGQLQTALHYCFTNPDQSLWQKQDNIVKKLIAAGAKVDAKDQDGFTPLRYAVFFGRFDAAQLLLNAGADINVTCNKRFTPLIWEIMVAHGPGVKWLLSRNCSVRMGPNFATFVIIIAFNKLQEKQTKAQKNKIISITKLLLDKTYEKNTLKNTKMDAYTVDESLLKELFRCNMLKNKYKDLTMPMLIACLNFEVPELMEHIVSQEVHKKTINVKNRFGKSALDYALEHGYKKITEILRNHGAEAAKVSIAPANAPNDDHESTGLTDEQVIKKREKIAAKRARQIANAQKRSVQEAIAKKEAQEKAALAQQALLAAVTAQAPQGAASIAAAAPAQPTVARASETATKDSKIRAEDVDQTPSADKTDSAAQIALRMSQIIAAKEKTKTHKTQLYLQKDHLENEIKTLNDFIDNTSNALALRIEKANELETKYYALNNLYKQLQLRQNKNNELRVLALKKQQLQYELNAETEKQKQLQALHAKKEKSKQPVTSKILPPPILKPKRAVQTVSPTPGQSSATATAAAVASIQSQSAALAPADDTQIIENNGSLGRYYDLEDEFTQAITENNIVKLQSLKKEYREIYNAFNTCGYTGWEKADAHKKYRQIHFLLSPRSSH